MRFLLKLFVLIPFMAIHFFYAVDQVQANAHESSRATDHILFMGDINKTNMNIPQISRELLAANCKVVTNGMETSIARELEAENSNFTSFQYNIETTTGCSEFVDKVLNSGYVFNAVIFCLPGLYSGSLSVDNASNIIECGVLPLLNFLEGAGSNLTKGCRVLAVIPQAGLDLLKNLETSNLLSGPRKGINLADLSFKTIRTTVLDLNRKHTLDQALFTTAIMDTTSVNDCGAKLKKRVIELNDTEFQSTDMQTL